MFVCCECRVLSGRGLCDELITHPEESYRLCCIVVCDLETSRIGAPYIYIYIYDISSLRVKQTRTPFCSLNLHPQQSKFKTTSCKGCVQFISENTKFFTH